MFFCDHNGSAPLAPEALRAMKPHWSDEFGNPSAIQTDFGKRSRAAVERAREQVAHLVGASAGQVIFVSGGTESCYVALLGAALSTSRRGEAPLRILSSTVEHAAVRETLTLLAEAPFSARVTKLGVDRSGQFLEIPGGTFDLCSLMLANNETGIVSALEEIFPQIDCRFIHSDVTQAVGRMPLDFSTLGVQAISFSAHKFGGPKGIGALVLADDAEWISPMKGGGQENGRRGGTEAVPLIVGFGVAAELAAGRESSAAVRDCFEARICAALSPLEIVGVDSRRLPNTSAVVCQGISAFEAVKRMEQRGLIVSAGAACQSKTFEPSRVLKAMGFSELESLGALRVSFGPEHSVDDAGQIADIFIAVIRELQSETGSDLNRRLSNA